MNKSYSRINWENYPSDNTPLDKDNLNKIDASVDEQDNRIITLDNTKATKVEVSTLIKEVAFDEQTGIITFTRKNGAKFTIDTAMEKIATGIYYDPVTEMLTLPLIDGTTIGVDLSRLITEYEFLDSDTIAFSVGTDGKVTAIVKEGSIQEKHLRPNYLADVKVEVAKAQASATAAGKSQAAAKTSENNAKQSEINAKASEDAAADSASDSADSATASAGSATSAAGSAATATQKATAAGNSATAAATSATNAANSKTAAAQSAADSAASAQTADEKASEASDSAAEALASRNAAKDSADKAKASENNAAASKTAAAGSASTASTKAGEAATSATNAANSAATATQKATAAGTSATNAANSASTATTKANAASASATAAAGSATSADTYAKKSQSYAVGTGGVRPNEATDSAKYYYEQAKAISETLAGTLRPKGTVAFANLPALASAEEGDMYNVSDEFITDSDFKEGVGHVIPAGSNVYKTADGKWDVLAGTPVSTVNGKTGNVEINLGNIGGILPASKGGSGKTSLNASANAFLNALTAGTSVPFDSTYVITEYAENGVHNTNTFHRRPLSIIYTYLLNKLTDAGVFVSSGNFGVSAAAKGLVLPRVGSQVTPAIDDANNLPTGARFRVDELDPSDANMPSAHWYHIYSGVGSDTNYATQLAIGMTVERMYFRSKQASAGWKPWRRILTETYGDERYKKITDVVDIAHGGTGANSAQAALKNLMAGALDEEASYHLIETDKLIWEYHQNQSIYTTTLSKVYSSLMLNLIGKYGLYATNSLPGTAGTAGYVNIIRIVVKAVYANYNLTFLVGGRGWALPALISVRFKNANTKDPELDIFTSVLGFSFPIKIKKTATSTWDIIVQKSEAYGTVRVLSFWCGIDTPNNYFTITYPGTLVTDISGYTDATDSGKIGRAALLTTARAIDGVSFNGSANITHYGTCSTAAATAAKTVALTGFTLVTGARVTVLFTVTNTAANPTLNVNSTGAKPIYYRNTAISAGYLAANRVYEFVYDGAQYELVGDINTNTTYANMVAATASAAGKAGLAPAPPAAANTKFLRGDATYAVPAEIASNVTGTYLEGFKGTKAIVKSTASAGGHVTLFKGNSTNGYFAISIYQTRLQIEYCSKATVDAGTNKAERMWGFAEAGYTNIRNILTMSDGVSTDKEVLHFYDDAVTNNNGGELVVGGQGGNTFIGSGESPRALRNFYNTVAWAEKDAYEAYVKTSERTYITSDANLYIVTGLNTVENRYLWLFDSNGRIYPILDNGQGIGNQSHRLNSVYAVEFIGDFIGTADAAKKLSNTKAIGSATKPVYFNSSGVPVACTYEVNKTVPADAVFTDTKYSVFTGATASAAGKAGLVPAPLITSRTFYLCGDGTWKSIPQQRYIPYDTSTVTVAMSISAIFSKYTVHGLYLTHIRLSVSPNAETNAKIGSAIIARTDDVTSEFGFARLRSDMSPTLFAILDGRFYTITMAAASQRKYKDNIRSIADEKANNLLKLNPVVFDYKKSFGGVNGRKDNHMGFIIDEFYDYFPELVVGDPDAEEPAMASIDYAEMVAPLTRLAQMQQEKIDEQEDRITNLEKENEDLKARIERLERMMDKLVQNKSEHEVL